MVGQRYAPGMVFSALLFAGICYCFFFLFFYRFFFYLERQRYLPVGFIGYETFAFGAINQAVELVDAELQVLVF